MMIKGCKTEIFFKHQRTMHCVEQNDSDIGIKTIDFPSMCRPIFVLKFF